MGALLFFDFREQLAVNLRAKLGAFAPAALGDQLGKLGKQSRRMRGNLRGVDGIFLRQLRKNFEPYAR